MILIDSNVFLIDRFFPRDGRYEANQKLVEKLKDLDGWIPVYNLLELLGIASFNLNEKEFRRWFYEFSRIYSVQVLYPPNLDAPLRNHFTWLQAGLFQVMSLKATYIDALMLTFAREFGASAIITWNAKHFLGRSGPTEVFDPQEFVQGIEASE